MNFLYKTFLLALLTISPFCFVNAQSEEKENLNAGFITGIWFSENPIIEENDIRIYSAIQNNSNKDLKGIIRLYIDDETVGEKDFYVINGRLIESWFDWKASQGEHVFKIELTEVFASTPGKKDYSVNLSNSVSNSIIKFVEKKKVAKEDSNSGSNLDSLEEKIKNTVGGKIPDSIKNSDVLGEVKGVITEKLEEEKEELGDLENYSESEEYKELDETDKKKHSYKLFISKAKVNTLEIVEKVSKSNVLLTIVLVIILILLVKFLLKFKSRMRRRYE